ncbi:hypothetical protein RFI_27057 [Reticulomyxa filosa]|uniref:Uncharacterized protein n=1 Tax=Reticulomyxa filosa TaxID=46433 RepID=X6M8K3_RETFI|nr:hypothetical protein RFI_27057 [Reticulomyxa filosa]|eukprot:ETO10318.1 hypothetical protein RFI_27057 [Reticulomyxa filosa]
MENLAVNDISFTEENIKRVTLRNHANKVGAVDMCLNPHNNEEIRVASVSEDGKLYIYDINRNDILENKKVKECIILVLLPSFHPKKEKKTILSSFNSQNFFFCLQNIINSQWVTTLNLHKRNDLVACGGLDNTVSIYLFAGRNASTRHPWRRINKAKWHIQFVEFFSDGTNRICCGGSGSALLYVFDYWTSECLAAIDCGQTALADARLCQDKSKCLFVTGEGTIQFLRFGASGAGSDSNMQYKHLQTICGEAGNKFGRICISPNDKYLACGGNGKGNCCIYEFQNDCTQLSQLDLSAIGPSCEEGITDVCWVNDLCCVFSLKDKRTTSLLGVEIIRYCESKVFIDALMQCLHSIDRVQLHVKTDLCRHLCTLILHMCGHHFRHFEISSPHTSKVTCLAASVLHTFGASLMASGGDDSRVCVCMWNKNKSIL